jgi:hypothetical protein
MILIDYSAFRQQMIGIQSANILLQCLKKVLQELISPDSNPDLNQCTLCKGAMRKGVRGLPCLDVPSEAYHLNTACGI